MENGKAKHKIGILDWILGKSEHGVSCWVIAEKFGNRDMLQSMVYPKQNQVVSVRYEWIDGSLQEFLGKEGSYLFKFKGKPVFYHGVGDLFANKQATTELMTSELYAEANDVNVTAQAVSKLKQYQEGGGLPWKWILIIAGAAIGVLILWQTGVIPNLLQSLNISISGPAPSVSPDGPIQVK